MKSKLMLIAAFVMLVGQVDYSAATIFASDGSPIDNSANICANDSYFYQTDSSDMYEAKVVGTDTDMLLTTTHAKNGEIEFLFPANVPNLSVYIYDYKQSDATLVDQFEFKVSDCGYESVTEDYKVTTPKTTISLTDQTLTFTEPDNPNYNLYVNPIEENDNGQSTRLKFHDGIATLEMTTNTVQITEDYTSDSGKEVTRYFELDLGEEPIIRKMDNLKLSVIEPMDYISRPHLIRIIAGFIALVILYIAYIRLRKQYKARKQYIRKAKEIKARQKQKLYEKKQAQDLAQKQKLREQKNAQAERERRQNLEIRK